MPGGGVRTLPVRVPVIGTGCGVGGGGGKWPRGERSGTETRSEEAERVMTGQSGWRRSGYIYIYIYQGRHFVFF